jgi:uncharacterized RDD family membrane protein YckC
VDNRYEKLSPEQQQQFKDEILRYSDAEAGKKRFQKTAELLNPGSPTHKLLRNTASITRPGVGGAPISSMSKRVAATLLDLLFFAIIINALRLFTPLTDPQTGDPATAGLIAGNGVVLVNIILSAYGGTVGKRMMHLATVRADTGGNIGIVRAFGRVVLMVLAIVPIRGWLFVTSTAYNATSKNKYPSFFIYERLTRTAVVDKKLANSSSPEV